MYNPTIYLRGDKINLCPIEMEHIDGYVRWLNDPDVRYYLLRQTPLNHIREKEWIENAYKSDTDIVLAIVVKDGNILIGNTGLHKINFTDRHAEFGIFIGDKEYWNKGYGSEATKMMVDYGFNTLNLHRIYLYVQTDNVRGIRAYEKAGFIKEGVLRDHTFKNGKYIDIIVMGIIK